MKRRIFSAFLTASMVLTQSAFVFATDATDTISTVGVPYTQDFEDANLAVYDYSGSATGVVTTEIGKYEQKTDDADDAENKNYYGRFITGSKIGGRRIGVPVDNKGIEEGKIKVSFRFRPIGLEQEYDNVVSYVGLGHETGAQTNYLALLAINPKHTTTAQKNRALGVLRSNGWQVPMKDTNNSNALLNEGDKDKWFTYTAEVDLDTRSIGVKVVNEDTKAEYTYEQTGIAQTTGSGNNIWDNWPKVTDMTQFVVTGPLDIDDLSITYILNAQELTFVSVNGEESDKCNILTSKAKIRFNTPVKSIGENAVTIDGNPCSGGALAEDGMSYTFDVSGYLNLGTTHNVAVDTSNIEAEIEGVLVGDGENFAFTVTPTIPYTQDFEDASLKATDFTNKVAVDANYFELKSDNGNGYGHFHHGNKGWYRIGFKVDETGITAGKVNVSFRFRPYGLSEDRKQLTFIAMGNASGAETSHLSLLGISGGTALGQMGVLQSNGTSYPMKDSEGANAVLTSADAAKWFTYNAVIDLDTRSLKAEVVKEEDGTKYTYSINNMAKRGASGWGLWPAATTNLQTFVAMGPVDIDDISVKHILKAQKLTFVTANGAEVNACSIFTPKAKVEFNMAVKSIDENAVTMDGKACPNGVLSADGMSYTFDIPENLVSGTAHNIAVDTSKAEAVLDVVLPGDGESFDFNVSATDAKAPVSTQNFDDATLKAINFSGGATSATSDVNLFELKSENENGYGHFHNGNKGWYRIGFQADANGVKEGKLNVSFRFRPYGLSEDRKQLTFVGLGDETSTTTDYLSLLGISGTTEKDGDKYLGRIGVMESNGTSNSMQDTDGKDVVLTSADAEKWFTYNAVINLDTRSLEVEVVREEDGAKYTYSKTSIAKRTVVKNGWGNWPINTSMKKFVAMGPIDIDDFSMSYDTNPAIVADQNGVKASVIAATTGDNLLIIAQYDGAGNLVSVTRNYVALEEGQSTVLEAEAAWNADATTAKAFIWDNFNDCTPLGTAKLTSKPVSE